MTKYITIPLSKTGKNKGKYVTIVDVVDEDLAKLNWYVSIPTRPRTQYAARIDISNGQRESLKMHRIILERKIRRSLLPGEQVDHIDHDGLNNRRYNLRPATSSQNNANAGLRVDNISGFKGVSWHKATGKWYSRIMVRGKEKSLGYFNDPEDAHAAYCKAADKYHGEFANHGK